MVYFRHYATDRMPSFLTKRRLKVLHYLAARRWFRPQTQLRLQCEALDSLLKLDHYLWLDHRGLTSGFLWHWLAVLVFQAMRPLHCFIIPYNYFRFFFDEVKQHCDNDNVRFTAIERSVAFTSLDSVIPN